jgi:hypothetical protein
MNLVQLSCLFLITFMYASSETDLNIDNLIPNERFKY